MARRRTCNLQLTVGALQPADYMRSRCGRLPCSAAGWRDSPTDPRAAARIAQRIVRLQSGLLGDVKPVSQGVSELRVEYGPGYRVYFVQRGKILIVLLCGGDKRTQARDIRKARALAADLED